MWITNTANIISALLLLLPLMTIIVPATSSSSSDEHSEKSDHQETRGKRNLQYIISHNHNYHHNNNGPPPPPQTYHRAERRIATGPQLPPYQLQYQYPGPRPYHNQDGGGGDLLTGTNQLSETVYGGGGGAVLPPPPKHVIERPVYIKEPEPIIEIIIKESNVSLPAAPTPPPPKKKKEQVQVFYVKYKKNPNSHAGGKDSVIYDKPIPALTPIIHHDDDKVEEPSYYHHHNHQSAEEISLSTPPPPSTTLRTVIHPDSETYHSPSGIKVTFGKESFDYSKRSNKADDLKPEHSIQFPQGRQLSSVFPPSSSNNYQQQPRRPSGTSSFRFPSSGNSYRSDSGINRQPQPYRPFNNQSPPPPPQFKQLPQQQSFSNINNQYSTIPKYLQFQQQPLPHYQQSPSVNNKPIPPRSNPIPPSPQFHQQQQQQQQQQFGPPPNRQPVPYQPFDNLRHQSLPAAQQQIQFRPQQSPHFPVNQQLPLTQQANVFNQFNAPQHHQFTQQQQSQPSFPNPSTQRNPVLHQQNQHQFNHRPQASIATGPVVHNQQLQITTPQQQVPIRVATNDHRFAPQQQQFRQQQNPAPQQYQQQLQQQNNNNEHLGNLQHAQNILPAGGELIQSVPKYEQHISVLESSGQQQQQQPQALALHQQQQQQQHNYQQQQVISDYSNNNNGKIQQQFRQANALQQTIQLQSSHQQYQPTVVTPPSVISTTTIATTTTTTTQQPPSTTTKDPTVLNAKLPDEVPDELREQLLASGILNNADISILDYDKVGDIPLSALPPDQLANFYNAGGAQQISAAASNPVPAIVKPEEIQSGDDDQETDGSSIDEVRVKMPQTAKENNEDVEMKVVHYDPDTKRGQSLQQFYVDQDAKQVDPVVLHGAKYNRYLPLKVSGTQFPLPDNVPELKGKRIASVVVLAPVSYDFSKRRRRDATKQSSIVNSNKDTIDIDLIQDNSGLKELLRNPTSENYRKFLDRENRTRSDKQSVILLVTKSNDDKSNNNKEIFMYDVATQSVSKLSGELSAAFVDAAEANSSDGTADAQSSESNIVETRVPYQNPPVVDDGHQEDLDLAGSDFIESRVPIIDPMMMSDDLNDAAASEQLESFVDFSGRSISPLLRRRQPIVDDNDDDLATAASDLHPLLDNNYISISGSSSSKTGPSSILSSLSSTTT